MRTLHKRRLAAQQDDEGTATPDWSGIHRYRPEPQRSRSTMGRVTRVLVGLLGRVGHHRDRLVPEARPARGQDRAHARVAVQVGVGADGHRGLGLPPRTQDRDFGRSGRLDLEHDRRGDRRDVGELTSDEQPAGFHPSMIGVPCFGVITFARGRNRAPGG